MVLLHEEEEEELIEDTHSSSGCENSGCMLFFCLSKFNIHHLKCFPLLNVAFDARMMVVLSR